MKTAQHTWMMIDDVLVDHFTEGQVASDASWQDFISDLQTKPYRKYISTIGGKVEVTSIQRKLAFDILTERQITVAVITDESVVLGIVTAASWFGVNIRAFAWSNVRDAMHYLHIPPQTEERIVSLLNMYRGVA